MFRKYINNEQIKSLARERNLFNENLIILGIAQDNPKFTEAKYCRYDTGLVVFDEFKADNEDINFGKIVAGKYYVFKISHTVDDIKKHGWRYFQSYQKEITNLMIEDLYLSVMQYR